MKKCVLVTALVLTLGVASAQDSTKDPQQGECGTPLSDELAQLVVDNDAKPGSTAPAEAQPTESTPESQQSL